jgi:AcrR family transcriptional regulator
MGAGANETAKPPPEGQDRLEGDKEERLFRAALSEFAGKGYALSSTNEITRAAGISKGLLFHYYGSKKALFLHVVERSIDFLMERFTAEGKPEESKDPFDWIMERSIVKMKLAAEQPEMYKLIFSAFAETPTELAAEMGEIYRRLFALSASFLGRAFDPSLLREGVDPAKAMDLLHLFLDGWTNRYMETYKRQGLGFEQAMASVEAIKAEALVYFDLIKKGIYKD